MLRESNPKLEWQSKAILLIVVPWTATNAILQSLWWARHQPVVAWSAIAISVVFGFIVWLLRAGTPAAAATGTAITATLIFASTQYPYSYSWLHGLLFPLLAVFVLTFAATKAGRTKKEALGTVESKRGRNAAQVAANLGISALAAPIVVGAAQISESARLSSGSDLTVFYVAVAAALAALAEAAADTVSSEIGQILGGQPRMLTTFQRVPPGTDGGISLAGTAAGVIAAAIVAILGSKLILGTWVLAVLAIPGAVFGLFVDSLLGATLERRGLLNNDAVNFLSTLSATLLVIVEARILFGHLSL